VYLEMFWGASASAKEAVMRRILVVDDDLQDGGPPRIAPEERWND
jgi:hypothetical protein